MDYVIVYCSSSILIGALIGHSRGRLAAGVFFSALLGPVGWLILLMLPNLRLKGEKQLREAHARDLKTMHEAHLAELRAIRTALVPEPPILKKQSEDFFWIQVNGREIGPVDRLEILKLFSQGRITTETPIARDEDCEEQRRYRTLRDEIPALGASPDGSGSNPSGRSAILRSTK